MQTGRLERQDFVAMRFGDWPTRSPDEPAQNHCVQTVPPNADSLLGRRHARHCPGFCPKGWRHSTRKHGATPKSGEKVFRVLVFRNNVFGSDIQALWVELFRVRGFT